MQSAALHVCCSGFWRERLHPCSLVNAAKVFLLTSLRASFSHQLHFLVDFSDSDYHLEIASRPCYKGMHRHVVLNFSRKAYPHLCAELCIYISMHLLVCSLSLLGYKPILRFFFYWSQFPAFAVDISFRLCPVSLCQTPVRCFSSLWLEEYRLYSARL